VLAGIIPHGQRRVEAGRGAQVGAPVVEVGLGDGDAYGPAYRSAAWSRKSPTAATTCSWWPQSQLRMPACAAGIRVCRSR